MRNYLRGAVLGMLGTVGALVMAGALEAAAFQHKMDRARAQVAAQIDTQRVAYELRAAALARESERMARRDLRELRIILALAWLLVVPAFWGVLVWVGAFTWPLAAGGAIGAALVALGLGRSPVGMG